MSRHAFDRKIAGLEALRSASDPQATREQLGKALTDCNDYPVSAITAELKYPDLLTGVRALVVDPVKADPQCMAKNAIVRR